MVVESVSYLHTRLAEGKRIINIDETWVDRMQYSRQKWRSRDASNSVSAAQVIPRLAVITAIDNHGKLYMCMTQTNTDRWVFQLFMTKLLQVS